MTKIIVLPGTVSQPRQYETNAEIVKHLEALLEKARNGDLRAIAYCTYDSGGRISTGWETGASTFCLGAAVMALNHRYSRRIWPDDDEGSPG